MKSCYSCSMLDRSEKVNALDGSYTYLCVKNKRPCVAGYVVNEHELKDIGCGFYKSSRYGEQLNLFNIGGNNDQN